MENFKFVFSLIFIYLIFVRIVFSDNIHEFMTDEEKIHTFDSYKSNETIPDYEIVRIWYETPINDTAPEISKMIVGYLDEEETVDLKPVENSVVGTMTPIWMASWKKDHMEFQQLAPIRMGQEIEIYQTSTNTIIGSGVDENGIRYFVGYIGGSTITPLTESVTQKVNRLKRNVEPKPLPESGDPNKNYVLSGYHIIYASSKFTEDNLRASAAATKKKVEEPGSVNISRKSKRQAYLSVKDVTIYPEILLYTDFGTQFVEPRGLLFNRFIIYLVAFWNGVNMFYRSLENPKISLRVTGIVIGTAPFDIPFLEKVTNYQNMIYDREAVMEMSKFFAQHESTFPWTTYDIAIAMTERHLCKKIFNWQTCKSGTLGIARVAALCLDYYGGVTMVGIVHDELDFRGIVIAAHELAHVMGVTHDGEKRTSAPYCDTSDIEYNYIMSPQLYDYNLPFVWSNCSRKLFSTHLAQNTKKCLRQDNMAYNGYTTLNILPGQLTNAEQQCKQRGYSHACDIQENICGHMKCWTEGFKGLFTGWKCRDSGPALDGTICGVHKICNARHCVDRPVIKSPFMSFLFG